MSFGLTAACACEASVSCLPACARRVRPQGYPGGLGHLCLRHPGLLGQANAGKGRLRNHHTTKKLVRFETIF